jgi:hypothetical protein
MESLTKGLTSFFGAPLRGQTYLNMLYLFLAFPLGLLYFVFLVTGLSLGLGLIIIWVGVFILLAVFAIWYGLLAFERAMAIGLLREKIPPMASPAAPGSGVWKRFTAALKNPVTWKGLLYLVAKFPIGIFSFVVLVTFLSTGLALLLAPAYYNLVNPGINITLDGSFFTPIWVVNSLPKAIVASVVGIFVLLIGLQAFNGLAWLSGKFARAMLGNFSMGAADVERSVEAAAVPAVAAEASAAAPAALSGAENPGADQPTGLTNAPTRLDTFPDAAVTTPDTETANTAENGSGAFRPAANEVEDPDADAPSGPAGESAM